VVGPQHSGGDGTSPGRTCAAASALTGSVTWLFLLTLVVLAGGWPSSGPCFTAAVTGKAYLR
jgi:hypothetical protein